MSEASVKRWADGGLLPAEKTAGGHRRFRPEDVALFRRDGLRQAQARVRQEASPAGAGETAGSVAPATDAQIDETLIVSLYDSLLAGRVEEASALLVRLHLEGRGVAVLVDDLVSPVMRRVGDLWHRGEVSVAQEHTVSSGTLAALRSLRAVARSGGVRGRLALCCSTENDFHELPVVAAAAVLEEAGWEVLELGTHTPFFALAEAVRRARPLLVCVASTVLVDFERAAREYAELLEEARRAGAAVVLGGAGFAGEGVRRRFPADLHAATFGQLSDFAASLDLPPKIAA